MAQITAGVGLVSGINYTDIINQLMTLEQQPVNTLQTRIDAINQQKLAYTDLSTRLTSLKLSGTKLKKSAFNLPKSFRIPIRSRFVLPIFINGSRNWPGFQAIQSYQMKANSKPFKWPGSRSITIENPECLPVNSRVDFITLKHILLQSRLQSMWL